MQNLQRIAQSIVATFGKTCEVAIHDFGLWPRTLVCLQGSVTGRKPGAPVTDLVLRVLHQDGDAAADVAPYRSRTADGKILKSSTTFIRDPASNEIVGAFCINFEVGSLIETLATLEQMACVPPDPGRPQPTETFASSLHETVAAIVEDYTRRCGKQPSSLTRTQRLALVKAIEVEGAFMVKGAVQVVAQYMGVTKSAVYSYLKEARAEPPEADAW